MSEHTLLVDLLSDMHSQARVADSLTRDVVTCSLLWLSFRCAGITTSCSHWGRRS